MTLDIKTTFKDIEESDVNQETLLSFSISKGAITKSGKFIRSYMEELKSLGIRTVSEEEFREALLVLKQYRENHIPYLRFFSSLLESKLNRLQIFEQSIVSSRSKRLESIANKLVVRKKMRLAQMDDVVGIRVTLPNINILNQFLYDNDDCEIVNSECVFDNFHTKNYILEPKDDGYRGIHQIFKCKTDGDSYVKLEMQIRTKIQHEWATVVEILGSLKNVSFKAGQGNKKYLHFLVLSSVLFSIEEGVAAVAAYANLAPAEVCAELNKLDKELQVIEMLRSFNSLPTPKNNVEAKYYLIQLDLNTHETIILPYNDEHDANEDYVKLEQTYQGSDQFDVVLVSVDDVNKIEEAYPNYFLDSNDFISRYNALLMKYS
ncbi:MULTISPECIES: RelA/SpoT domain-containing protein [Psychrobacter]|uniref:RelA/SpoT domain-containing protein n=1 Tax=Psychrobacter TaxID=497 RepID=UPI0018693CFC|nr:MULTISPECIES: RelA/SpoT domain-containing protein [Psychrobacter]